ncbi:MAG: dihydroneopterin aldolase [Verrucomicrobia bacterium]|nr:dihydroneopterin aldolase [Verrucomicrobiota bacterium]
MPDEIEIRRLKVHAYIGVPDEERSAPQDLLITARLTPSHGFDGLADEISRTVDYHAVAIQIQELAAAHPRKLIETLATELCDFLLLNHPLVKAAISIEKHILPNTECVAVHIERSR